MLDKKPLDKILFLDIETTSQYPRFKDMQPRKKELFLHKFRNDFEGVDNVDDKYIESIYDKRAPLSPEFGKIVCISILKITDPVEMKYKSLSICSENEVEILNSFIAKAPTISKAQNTKTPEDYVCSHFGFLFDWPFIAKRMLYNGIKLPFMFDYAELKSWDVNWFIDTGNIWKFTTFDGGCSLDLLCECFGIESPKSIMSGDKVKSTYWIEKDYKKISNYCEQDTLALASCFLKMKGIDKQLTK